MSEHETEKKTQTKKHFPTDQEVDELVTKTFTPPNAMCSELCGELQSIWDALPDLPPKVRAGAIARIAALRTQMKQLHCPLCLPR